ncbi:MAG: GNAT family N-acetyltransferase [Acidobacteria bacterium]|nr:GNAT family N-acetyltransferase [Acidobacteriota bacterium]
MPNYTIRECDKFEDYEKCIELQRKVWHTEELEVTPPRIYIISKNSGGFLVGAFTLDNQLLAFLHSFGGFDEGLQPIYYSHMLAVLPEYRNSGLGQELKLWQRERALKQKIQKITWTFDPLRSLNAHFNINKLGCIVRQYKINFYGTGNTSVFDSGIEADRLKAEWWVNTQRVKQAINSQIPPIPKNAPYIEIPIDISEVRERSLEETKEWRYKVREEFQKMFLQGLTCVGFLRGQDTQLSRYYFAEYLLE